MSGVGDKISHLPDSIIHHIFSFMETRMVVQTTLLSKRWSNLWMSNPYLFFEGNDIEVSSDDWSKLVDFIDFVDRVLMLRDASNIHKFSLFCQATLFKTRVHTWLIALLNRCVQELDLVLVVDQPTEFPTHIFTSNVKVLKLSDNGGDVQIRMPHSMSSAARIKILDLDFVKLPDGDYNGELNLSCPVLERLVLSRCDISHLKVVTISALRLESLVMISGYDDPNDFCKINICSPNLKSLVCVCDTHWDCCLENLSALTYAHIVLGFDIDMEKEVYTRCLIKLLKGVYNVKAIYLSSQVLEAIAFSPDILDLLPSLFHNLRDITLEVGDDAFTILMLIAAVLLKKLPCIENLVLERYKDMALGFNTTGGDWCERLPAGFVFRSLKTVKIHNLQGTEDELKFLKFILERSIFLEAIFITTPVGNNLNNFSEKLFAFSRASSNVLIRFQSDVEA